MTETVLLGLLAALVVVLGALVAALTVAWRRTRVAVTQTREESRALAESLAALQQRLPSPDARTEGDPSAPVGERYVITGLSSPAPATASSDEAGSTETVPDPGGRGAVGSTDSVPATDSVPGSYVTAERIEGRLFADLVARESVAKAAGLAAGLRRGLAPENRDRIRGAVRRELKRARKQRRAEERQALRDLRARQRDEEGEAA